MTLHRRAGDGRLSCELHCASSHEHLEQIYTGFGLLARRGLISLRLRRDAAYSAHLYRHPLLRVLVRGPDTARAPVTVTFDLWDQADLPDDLYGSELVIKRSYDAEIVARHPARDRIQPLGLNYAVVERAGLGLRRALWSRNPRSIVTAVVRQSRPLSRLFGIQHSLATCRMRMFEGLPRLDDRPGILFTARLWDPGRVSDPSLRRERDALNTMRVECIRALRARFPDRFTGGLEPTPYAQEHFPDCVVDDTRTTRRDAYLRRLHASSICIATRGLRGSIGWKFPEYIAAAKAIVSEPLHIAVPGPLRPGTNYLTFTTPAECVERVRELVDDVGLRFSMMRANAAYYAGWLRPDMLVWNALTSALFSRTGSLPDGVARTGNVEMAFRAAPAEPAVLP